MRRRRAGPKKVGLPLTAKGVVNRIIPSLAAIDVGADGLWLVERAPGTAVAEMAGATEPDLHVTGDVPEMSLLSPR